MVSRMVSTMLSGLVLWLTFGWTPTAAYSPRTPDRVLYNKCNESRDKNDHKKNAHISELNMAIYKQIRLIQN